MPKTKKRKKGPPKNPPTRSSAPKLCGLKSTTVSIKDIIPAEYNPRVDLSPASDRYQAICRSIERFGAVQPAVINRRTGSLVSGHQRMRILRDEFNATDIDAVFVDLSPAEERALNVALNNPAVGGEWDKAKLTDVLRELQNDPKVDETDTGFSEATIRGMLVVREDNGHEPEQPKKRPKVEIGQRFRLGDHRVFVGDGTSGVALRELMEGSTADCCVCEVPG